MAEPTPPSPSPSPSHEQLQQQALGFNGMVIGAALVCALLCALGLNSMLHCVFQCTHRAVTEPAVWMANRRNNTGLKKKEMGALPTSTFNANSGSCCGDEEEASSCCAICLAEFMEGDRLRELPKCSHSFHVACIDQWLISHSSCPTCRRRLNFPSPSHMEIVTTL